MSDSTLRFSSRVENYVKYRPGYPQEVITTMGEECSLTPESLVADIGSGTGILTELFLQNGNTVLAVEPNREMRQAAEKLLQVYPCFRSIAGRAEATTLDDHCVDFIVAGQAFHWFDRTQTRNEFARILRNGGWVMLIWNDREIHASPFLEAYEQLLRDYSIDYGQVDHRQIDESILLNFYGPFGYRSKRFSYRQQCDYQDLVGRLLSSSYTPETDHPNHEPMMAELARIFQTYEVNNQVTIDYITKMYYGRFSPWP